MNEKSPHMPPLEVHDLTVAYNQKPVLWNIDFEIPEGSLTAVVGPNGAGKSTLIKAIMGLIPSSSGYALFYGKPLGKRRSSVAYVPQRESVDWNFPVNVFDVVLMGRYPHLKLFQRPRPVDKEIAMNALKEVGMQEYSDRQISRLSGGQQQRVFLARALAQDASVYLMDEPFAGVDAATERVIFNKLKELQEQQKTILVVHHDLQNIKAYFDHVMMLNLRLTAFGPTQSTFTDDNLQKTYGGRLNILSQIVERSRQERFVREKE
ncbi:metal ABC transporter ATP-binding protein [Balneolaceae bacterium ANBcel3]|nr:metal ABC transporter ATP-binding protein [Balneolaceae bacterium ANBcel3]